jgi:2,3-bisphosphoglycerate-independent phosphoglycerate mutase
MGAHYSRSTSLDQTALRPRAGRPKASGTMQERPRPLVLIILDGFGLRDDRHDNAVALAKAPRFNALWASYPHSEIGASGRDVGLPDGQMGNSEVGHLNFGAGRIAQMDIARIDCAIADGTLGDNAEIKAAITLAKQNGGRFHLLGLVSDGGVHSSLEHLLALVDLAAAQGVPVVIHAFLDGRDTPPRSAERYLTRVIEHLQGRPGEQSKGVIGTVSGRYWAMDRDSRWDRVKRAYDAIVSGAAPRVSGALEAVEAAYAAGKDDEFIEPVVVGQAGAGGESSGYAGVRAGKDAALFFNFRADRAREITAALTQPGFEGFARPAGLEAPFARYVCMTMYEKGLGLPVAFPKETYPDIFPELVARAGLTQLRCAETEKFAHVTYFFNGGREEPFAGEERVLVKSPRDVATYDEKPEMSAQGVADAVVAAIGERRFDFILVNFANPDMVGHTGSLEAAIAAVEAADRGVGAIVDAALAQGGAVLVTADHGNCELMRDPVTGAAHTAHTTNPVPFLYVNDHDRAARLRPHGRLCDVAPTMLALLGLPQPAAMTGESMLQGKQG